MPYPQQFQYLTIIGDAFSGTERWQFGLKLTDGGVSNEATALAASDDVAAWWRGDNPPYVTSESFLPPSTHRLTELKCARIGVDGLYPEGEQAYSHFYIPPLVGAGAPVAGSVPQNSVAVSLRTAVPRGLASKGRVFLPPSTRYGIDPATGLMSEANANALRACVDTLIQQINQNTVIGTVAIFSRGKGVPSWDPVRRKVTYTYPNPGAVNNVTAVRVGRVIDTQRRRRRQLPESYTADAPIT